MAMHMLKYHLAIPLAIFAVLVVAGVPVGTALFVGAMAGCMSMMLMMMGGQRAGVRAPEGEHRSAPSGTRDDAERGSSS